jgi:hypothetical protein
MSDSIDIDKLEQVARAAQAVAPGPYEVHWMDDEAESIDGITDANGENVVIADSGVYPPRGAVAAHIAATSPDVVLALIARVRRGS